MTDITETSYLEARSKAESAEDEIQRCNNENSICRDVIKKSLYDLQDDDYYLSRLKIMRDNEEEIAKLISIRDGHRDIVIAYEKSVVGDFIANRKYGDKVEVIIGGYYDTPIVIRITSIKTEPDTSNLSYMTGKTDKGGSHRIYDANINLAKILTPKE